MRLAHDRFLLLSALITAATSAVAGACGGVTAAGSADAGPAQGPDGSGTGSSSSGADAGHVGSSSSGSSSGSSSSGSSSGSSSSGSGSSSGGIPNCPVTTFPLDPTKCGLQVVDETLVNDKVCAATFQQPCGFDGVLDAGPDAGDADPCAVCRMIPNPLYQNGFNCYPYGTGDGGLTVSCGGACCTGRAPRGFSPQAGRAASARAAYLAQMAQLEAASVDAFHALHHDLARLRAPRWLLAAVRAAAADEVRHARAVERLAARHGADVPRTRVPPIAPRSLEQLAIENAEEGCVNETFGAAIGALQAERASDPRVRRLMRVIARDELGHAALAWRVADWLDARLDAAGRERVRRARREAIEGLRARVTRSASPDPVLGLPDAATAGAILDRMTESLATGDLVARAA
jgi:hypothetical protein